MEEPVIEVEQSARRGSGEPGQWLFTWRLRNKTADAMHLSSVRVPHGKFKAAEKVFAPSLEIASEKDADLELAVNCREAPNTLVENAFLILLIDWRRTRWRLFVRLEIRVDQDGTVDARTESITLQRAGFSGVA